MMWLLGRVIVVTAVVAVLLVAADDNRAPGRGGPGLDLGLVGLERGPRPRPRPRLRSLHRPVDGQHRRIEPDDDDNRRTSVYVMEQTIAMITYAQDGAMMDCQLFDVGTRRERDELLHSMPAPATPVDLHNMVTMVDSCQYVTSGRRSRGHSRSGSSSAQYFNVFSGIMPGTKWCGHNNVARSYSDLGSNLEVDKCCRAHDYCPLKIQPLTTRYGIFNFGFYTKSHCMCDSMFYQCLKQSRHSLATFVGNIFFNILQVKCVREKNFPRSHTCLHERILNTGERICDHWEHHHSNRNELHIVSPSVTY